MPFMIHVGELELARLDPVNWGKVHNHGAFADALSFTYTQTHLYNSHF